MKKITNELKVGLVIFAAILTGLFFWIKTSDFKSEMYRLKTYFTRADGIRPNAVVALAGIEVGRVENVRFVYESNTMVELVLLIDKKARVKEDSIAFVASTGFVGDAYIGITPGVSDRFLRDGATLLSEDPVEMRELMKRADKIAKNLDVVLSDIKTIVSDNRDKVDSIIVNLEETSANFNEFSDDIKRHPWKLIMKGKEKKAKRR